MKHSRKDYDRIQDPSGKIPADEPVFLLRAQDEVAWIVVLDWAVIAETRGVSPELVKQARDQAEKMRVWSKKKLPDMPVT